MVLDRFKRTAKRFARPVLRPLISLSNRPVALLLRPQLGSFNERVATLNIQLERAQQMVGRHQRTIDDLVKVWLRVRHDLEKIEARFDSLQKEQAERLKHGLDRFGVSWATASPEAAPAQASSVVDGLRLEFEQRGARVDDTLRFLQERVEFVRRELMFEINYGERADPRRGVQSSVETRILQPDKVAQAKTDGEIRLNLGCGHLSLPDYINVDMRDVPGVDVVADVGHLPFDPGTIDEIFSAHLIEHFPQESLRRRLLPHWRAMLRSGGALRAIVPDGEAMLKEMAKGSYSFDDFREVLFGGQEYGGDFHFNLLTPDSLVSLVKDAGFEHVEIPVRGRRNGQCFEFELIAAR